MKRQDLLQIGAYLVVSLAAVGGAFAISLRFLGPLAAQDSTPPAAEAQVDEAQAGEAPPAATPSASAPAAPPAESDEPPAEKGSGLAELEGFLEPFIYDMVNRRDPFTAFAEYVPSNGPGEEGPARPLSPAQRFALEELRLVGIMWDVREPKAMFMDPEKEVLMLGRDESIGNKNGYIAAIREGEVVVVEALRKRGEIIYRTRVLRIER